MDVRTFLDKKVTEYNKPSFIKDDPVCIPHLFTKKQDIEIAGLFASVFAWGNRTIIIKKSRELMQLMDMAPYDFIVNHEETDLKRMLGFKHRTFNATDLLYFIAFLQYHYQHNRSLETAFFPDKVLQAAANGNVVELGLIHFHHYFFSLEDYPHRTKKHIASPEKNSNCKRLNMFLRWMVRADKCGVDFGIWKRITPASLICPVDLHVARVATRFDLLDRKVIDWNAAVELTGYLRTLDPEDPVKYDFALFALGVMEKYV
ncbi:TIGR02757 family protein [Deminuibacter soli]|uniref:TIGR02757 family protein n=1 Tax=Deminuibacter soli TaxID=2291815 RepID=A0A3E1NSC1_9BACT|nr:TIGR02757 family protein [Deminuibacter soli]RFM30658.1 TIGR02757 family protein [Deminuibacter soli]